MPVLNFAAGPAKLPQEVLKEAQADLMNYNNTGMSVMELSHRSPEFTKVINDAEKSFRELLNIPENYSVLFVQGGASQVFSTVPLNFSKGQDSIVDYFVTGTWSQKAAKEAEKYCKVNVVNKVTGKYDHVPSEGDCTFSDKADYIYYCDNETVHGVEFPYIPNSNNVPLICDMSSNFMSRKVDVSKFACIFGGVQKNLGPAGCTVVIVKKDFLGNARPITPVMLDLKVIDGGKSMYNTPPTFTIYMVGLVLNWLQKHGGIEEFEKRSQKKSELLYSFIDSSDGFYQCTVVDGSRSRMNVPFRIKGGDSDLETAFLDKSKALGMVQLKGHRSVGGIRASIYNSIEISEVETLIDFMKTFHLDNQ